MQVTSLRWALPAILTIAFAAASQAGSRDHGAGSEGLQGKIEYCTYCHGASGQGYRAYYTMPRIAGQTPRYLVNQLRAYAAHRRKNAIMYSVAHSMSPSTMEAVAEHFSHLHPRSSGSGSSERVAAGRKIFQEGVPNDNVPACAACHGDSAEGYEQNPRLAGQLASYVEKTLSNWSHERGQGEADTSQIMQPVARRLSKSQIAAVAAYVSSLK
jgi:cytochrome c553